MGKYDDIIRERQNVEKRGGATLVVAVGKELEKKRRKRMSSASTGKPLGVAWRFLGMSWHCPWLTAALVLGIAMTPDTGCCVRLVTDVRCLAFSHPPRD